MAIDTNTQVWILSSANAILVLTTSYFLKNWMSAIKDKLDNQENELKSLEEKHQKEIIQMNNENGKRKGEIELLKKDVEKLASDTSSNFENIKIHLSYQKSSLEEIKKDAKDRKHEMDENFKKLFEIISKK